jgi:hypothetical protein
MEGGKIATAAVIQVARSCRKNALVCHNRLGQIIQM